ncbi:hypothetical protein [Celeribacter sp.]|uniref:hypothetical protein n=1 Tax=Celeribacter sp. TaxID=1890673 RepID=UPI003A8D0314
MTNLSDMPMVTIEQKNRFREAALKVEADRDALAAWLDECLSAMRHASEFLDEFDKDAALALHRMNSLSSRSRGPDASLTARDARMKSEALEEAGSICMSIECGQREMSYKYTETDGDGDEMVVGQGVNYANKAMGAGHCRERIAEMIAEYRKQAEGEA